MGYRSDVKLITTKEGWKRIRQAVTQTDDGGWSHWSGNESTVPICNGKYVLTEWCDVKWYERHDDVVDAIMRELKRFDAEHIPYQYLRIGEDWDDNEYLWERDWKSKDYDDMPYLALERTIEVEYQV